MIARQTWTRQGLEFAIIRMLFEFVLVCWLSWTWGATNSYAEEGTAAELPTADLRAAFISGHDGWSLDEVMLSDVRRKRLVDEVRKRIPDAEEKQIWESLVRLRKSGKFDVETTRRANTVYGDSIAAAEIAARRMQDEHQTTFDQVLIDPDLLQIFDQYARAIDRHSDSYALRKAALYLRKSRQLTPELVLRVTDWKQELVVLSVEEAKSNLESIPKRPGVYIFRDETGYLYIGQSNNVRDRLTQHLDASDRRNLARYLAENAAGRLTLEVHVFREGSPGEQTTVRKAYESELIRSRKPRLNLSP